MRGLICEALKGPQSLTPEEWNKRYTQILDDSEQEHVYISPPKKKGRRGRQAKPPVNNLIERFKAHMPSILRFISEKAIPFTNNQGERDLRMAKVQQKISGTFRTWQGAEKFARIRSYLSTAQKQSISPFHAIQQALLDSPMFSA
ncbi:MAG: transposase [Verrucomicrobiota bacterium]